MTTEKMTVHKALAELKIIDDRIMKTINESTFCVANRHSNERIKGVTIEEIKRIIQGGYDKSSALISRRNAIKRAVVLSNATTKIKVGETEYTVAEAIEMKNHGITFKEVLMNSISNQYKSAQATILKENGADLEKRAEQYVTGLYGSKEGKINTDDFERTKQDFVKANTFELIDPLAVLNKINDFEKEITEFRVEIDAALSTSNAITEIEINY